MAANDHGKAVLRLESDGLFRNTSSLVEENAALRAEVGQNKALIADLTQDMNEYHDKAEKAEAEVERLTRIIHQASRSSTTIEELMLYKARAKKAEAELDAARPAIKFWESFQSAIAKGPTGNIADILGFDPMEFIKDRAAKEGK